MFGATPESIQYYQILTLSPPRETLEPRTRVTVGTSSTHNDTRDIFYSYSDETAILLMAVRTRVRNKRFQTRRYLRLRENPLVGRSPVVSVTIGNKNITIIGLEKQRLEKQIERFGKKIHIYKYIYYIFFPKKISLANAQL